MIDALMNMPPEFIDVIMLAVMLFAIFASFPISFNSSACC